MLANGVSKRQITFINFEDLAYADLTEYRRLYAYLNKKLLPKQMNYIFLDEIQHVPAFEKVADSLFIKKNVDLYITGSNAYFMSGELATLLTGRYVELKMLPLSFKEYCQGRAAQGDTGRLTKTQLYQTYLQESSFPYTLSLTGRPREITEYLEGLYSSILLKDVVARYKITDVLMLESIFRWPPRLWMSRCWHVNWRRLSSLGIIILNIC